MAEYDNTNRGAIFKNDKKTSENHPDYKGSINVEGVEYWQSLWLKKDKNGKTFMSQSITRKEEAQKPAPKGKPAFNGDMSDDIPFDNPYRGITRCYSV